MREKRKCLIYHISILHDLTMNILSTKRLTKWDKKDSTTLFFIPFFVNSIALFYTEEIIKTSEELLGNKNTLM